MSSANDPALGMVVGDRYILVERINEDAVGVLYQAEHSLLRSRFRVLLVHENLSSDEPAVQRYHTVLTTAARMQSESIVKASDFGRFEDGRVFVAFEDIDGLTLETMLERQGNFSVQQTLDVLEQLGDALSEAHALGLVHGDLRPKNVMLVERKERQIARLLGLGLRLLGGRTPAEATAPAASVDHAHFISPEQAQGQEADARSDIYSLGLLGYTMLAGVPPFSGKTTFDLLAQQIETPAPRLGQIKTANQMETVPEAVASSIERALAKKKEDRFPTVVRFLQHLGIKPPPVTQTKVTANAAPPDAATSEAKSAEARPSPVERNTVPTEPAVEDSAAATKQTQVRSHEPQAKASETNGDADAAKTMLGTGITAADVQRALDAQHAAKQAMASSPTDPATPSDRPSEMPASNDPNDVSPSSVTLVEMEQTLPGSPPITEQETAQPSKSPQAPRGAANQASSTPIEAATTTKLAKEPSSTPSARVHENTDNLETSGDWFAAGVAAEAALGKGHSSSTLPSIYGNAIHDDLQTIRRGPSPTLIIGGVVAVAVVLLGVAVFVTGDDGDTQERLADQTKRVTPAQIVEDETPSTTVGTKPNAAALPTSEPIASHETRSDAATTDRKERPMEQAVAASKTATPATDESRSSGQPTDGSKPKHTVGAAKQESTAAASSAPRVAKALPPTTKHTETPRRSEPAAPETKDRRQEPRSAAQKDQAKRQIGLARRQLERGGYGQARQLFLDALKLDPDNAAAHGGLGEVDFELGKYNNAATNLRSALSLSPSNPRYRVMLGNVYFKQGRMDAAVAQYRRALRLDPKNAAARTGLEAAVRRIANDG